MGDTVGRVTTKEDNTTVPGTSPGEYLKLVPGTEIEGG